MTAPAGSSPPVAAIDDASLVARALDGDSKAEDLLYRRHGLAVLNTVARLLGDKQDAADVVQDTFLDAFQRLDTLRDPAKFRSWVLRIGVLRVRGVIRRKRVRRRLGLQHTAEDASLYALADSSWSPEMRAQLALADDILRRLPTDHRLAWSLRHIEGYKLREISELAGWSMSSTKRYLKAAEAEIGKQVRIRSRDDE